ncbi:MAG TPA: substrate-binding domain-containing protein [Gammaproteobacteria bacterium]|nr:substrate-binding domain-containing protein [Gammaproteobacteria bacterium]
MAISARAYLGWFFSIIACSAGLNARVDNPFIVVASTTSTQDSGLFDYLLPQFEKKTGIDVRVVAVGTGQAIDIAERCDADVLFVHHKPSEEEFVAQGYGVERHPVMWNDFVVVGPKSDPAHIEGMQKTVKAFKRIAQSKATFASRGDDSGTNKEELELWQAAGINVDKASGTWYRESGQGMGPTLNIAASMDAYTLTDRGTWISFNNRGDLEILVHGDPRLSNEYGITLVNIEHCPNVKAKAGQEFIDWLISKQGQKTIGAYKLRGQQLFHPSASDRNA